MKFTYILFSIFFVVQAHALENYSKVVCTECHSDLTDVKFVHAPAKNNGCISCHQAVPAAQKSKKMDADHPSVASNLGKDQAAGCIKCHSEWGKKFKAKKNPHGVISKNGCTACHSPHGSNNKNFLKTADINQGLCFTCHKKNDNWEKGEKISTHPALDMDEKCFTCHEVHSSAKPKLLKQEGAALCSSCHDVAEMKPKGSMHTPVKNGECTGCHSPHYGSNVKLLNATYEPGGYVKNAESSFQLCLSCHDLGSMIQFKNGSINLHNLHITKKMDGLERGCSVCHVPHGSSQEMQIRTSFTYNKISVPMTFIKNKNGGSCTVACHGKKDYDRVTPVTNKEGR